jgi:EAL domain-containing protein (putative c-di-GMP-specific phosphodiesterase class I)
MTRTAADFELQRGIADRLMAALQQDEFVLHAQPISALASGGGERGFQEIFVRFREEDAKLLPPGTFFPVLQEVGMLPYLDRWVVNRLARHVRSGLKIHPDWKVPRFNVNLSDESLLDPKFAHYVLQYVDHSYLSGGTLGVDISCASALAHRQPVLDLMAALRPHGCGLTLAGFDGSEATLARIQAFAPNFIKVSAASVDPLRVGAISRMCHGVNAQTIAEHVEDPRVLEHLRSCRIDFAQGYAVARVEPL